MRPKRCVGLRPADDSPPLLLAISIENDDGRADADRAVTLWALRFDYRSAAHAVLKLTDAALKKSLLIFGGVVLGAVRDVAKLLGALNHFRHLRAAHVAEPFKLLLHALQPLGADVDLVVGSGVVNSHMNLQSENGSCGARSGRMGRPKVQTVY